MRVLFIGNNFTCGNDLPGQPARFAADKALAFEHACQAPDAQRKAQVSIPTPGAPRAPGDPGGTMPNARLIPAGGLPAAPSSTGLPGLDRILHGLRPGDNVVWQVQSCADYIPFVRPFVEHARQSGVPLVYFRFADHEELLGDGDGAEVHRLDPGAGFETFITDIYRVIDRWGPGTCYVFDMFSDLAAQWYSERMVGNFFMLTCPYLYRLDTLAYFAILDRYHSYFAAVPIEETTQLLLNVRRHDGRLFVHPIKVDGRHSETMFTMHAWEGGEFVPISDSSTISEVLSSSSWPGLQSASYRMIGLWDRRFLQAESMLEACRRGEIPDMVVEEVFHRQLRHLVSSEEKILDLCKKYFTLEDLIRIWKRTIGSGMIGGKSFGMLLARAILKKNAPRWEGLLEPHDSFYIGSDLFYSYLVQNGCWWIRQKQKDPQTFLEGREEGRRRILEGKFPDYILRRFADMLKYFGQSPIIVRSSSLQEDNFGNAFAGKYESVFCANQGTLAQNLEEFLKAVRLVYASTMTEEALGYRAKRGVLQQDEQMALLVQRVSGAAYGGFYFPPLAGVGFSYNPYVWNEGIDPDAGMLRLVVGLGTRAVDRADDDYTRVVALNAPEMRPESSFEQVKRYAQRRVDYLDLRDNRFASGYFIDMLRETPGFPVDMVATMDDELAAELRRKGASPGLAPWILTFSRLFGTTPFIADMREMLAVVAEAYGRHVDVEFTVNFRADGSYRVNLLQCRPFQIKMGDDVPRAIPEPGAGTVVLEAHGGVIGRSRVLELDRVIFVEPELYGRLGTPDRYAVARLIGRLAHLEGERGARRIMIIGPGRWGTSTPALGVPVSFAEINTVSVLCEIDSMHEGLVPDLSLGTHFFNELVEMDMVYIGYFGAHKDNLLDRGFLRGRPNRLAPLLPDDGAWAEMVLVVEPPDGSRLTLHADHMRQRAVLLVEPAEAQAGVSP